MGEIQKARYKQKMVKIEPGKQRFSKKDIYREKEIYRERYIERKRYIEKEIHRERDIQRKIPKYLSMKMQKAKMKS